MSRVKSGDKHHSAKYSDETVAIIRKNYRRWVRISEKASPKALAHRFNMPYNTLISIIHERHRLQG